MAGVVSIVESGRSGSVAYAEGGRTINGYWEFGGGDVITIISMGTREEWGSAHAWALPLRAAILRRVADEAIRQRAPTCVAEIDDARGDILLRQSGGAATNTGPAGETPRARAAAFVYRLTRLKAIMGLVLLVAVLVVGGLMLLARSPMSTAAPGSNGVPLNDAMRTDTHIASLIQTSSRTSLDISGRGGANETSVSMLLIPLDGGAPHVVQAAKKVSSGSLNLARIMGSDGRTLWLDAGGLYGVRLSDYRLVTPKDLQLANPQLDISWWEDQRGMDVIDGKLHVMRIDRSAALDIDPATLKATPATPKPGNARFQRHDVGDHLAAGLITASGGWLGLHSDSEIAGAFKPGKWVRPIESADDTKEMRRLYTADLEPDSEGKYFKLGKIMAVNQAPYLNAVFLRMDDTSEPVELASPAGALMLYTTSPALGATATVSRVDETGKIGWSVDTGIDRFKLQQILPGETSFAFVGARPPIPDKLSEPIVVIIDTVTGKATTQSLWR